MDPWIYHALTMSGPGPVIQILRIYDEATTLLRQGATLALGFMIRNPGKDTTAAAFQSKYGFKPVLDTLAGFDARLRHDARERLYLQSGAGQSAFYAQDRNDLRKALREMKRERWRDIAHTPVEFLRAINSGRIASPLAPLQIASEMGEQATKIGEFALALKAEGFNLEAATRLGAEMDAARARWLEAEDRLKQGITPSGVGKALEDLAAAEAAFDVVRVKNRRARAQAAMAARDVVYDRQRAGENMRPLNRIVAFLNAGAQGADRFFRAFAEDPQGAFLRATYVVTLPTVILWALNHDDEEYRELPEHERQTYWHFPLHWAAAFFDKFDVFERLGGEGAIRMSTSGKAGWIRVSKPFAPLGMVFGTAVEKALDYNHQKDPDAWKRLVTDDIYDTQSMSTAAIKLAMWKMLLSVIPTTVIPALEAKMNYSTYRERHLISPFEERHTPVGEQSTPLDECHGESDREGAALPTREGRPHHLGVLGRAVARVHPRLRMARGDGAACDRRWPRPARERHSRHPRRGGALWGGGDQFGAIPHRVLSTP